jgi:hypothetical protein
MPNRLIDRIGALTGVAYVVLVALGNDILRAASPDSSASSQVIGAWWRAHPPGTYEWSLAFLELVALLCFPVFVVVLAWRLREADRGSWLPWLALVAGSLSACVKLASGAPIFALAWRSGSGGVSDELATALVDMNSAAFVLTWALDAVMLAAAARVILTTSCLPRWIGWFAAVTAPLLLVTVPLAMTGPPAFLLALIWIVATSITMAVRLPGHARSLAATAVS